MTSGEIDLNALGRLLALIGGDPDDLGELREDFLASTPETVARLLSGVDEGDQTAIRIAAHTLKSNAQDFGALRLSQLCAELEGDCRNGTLDEVGAKAATIAEEAALVGRALSTIALDTIAGANTAS